MAALGDATYGLAKAVMGGLDDLFTSDEERAQAEYRIMKMLGQPHVLQAIANVEAAKSTNWFVAGGRPALLWVTAVGLFYQIVLRPIVQNIVEIVDAFIATDLSDVVLVELNEATLTGLVTTLLGLGAMRTWEKMKGVARG